jgi:alanyl-tRNA synthetase
VTLQPLCWCSAAAYGFPADLTDEAILEKLLALNLERAAEEAKAAKVKQPKTSRDKKRMQ